MMKLSFKTILGGLCALVAILVALDPIFWRHWFVLLTFGQFPGLKTYGPSCDATSVPSLEKSARFTKHKHCFNETGGMFWYDAAHNESLTKEILLKAVEKHCPVLVSHPFKDDKCFERLESFAEQNSDFELRVRENFDDVMDNSKSFPE